VRERVYCSVRICLYVSFILFLVFKHLNAELNSICHLLALLGAHHIFHISRIRVKVWKSVTNFYLLLKYLFGGSFTPTSHNKFIFCCFSMRLCYIHISPSLDRHQTLFLTPCKRRMGSKTSIRGARIITVLVIISYSTVKLN
jgi:hypothetical protein